MKVMVGNKVIASVCSALVVASLLDVQADVVLPPHDGDLMIGPPHADVQCIDGVCIPARVTNGFYPTRWRKWPIVPPAPAQRGVREGISPPTVDIPKSDVETEIPGRQGMPGQPRRAPPSRELDGGVPDREPSDPSTSPTLPVEPREPAMPPELDDLPPRSDRERSPQFPRNDRLPRRTPPVASRSMERQASLIDAVRTEAAGHDDELEDRALPSVRVEPKVANRPVDIDPSAATPDPSPWQGTRPARSSKPVNLRAPAEQPRAGSAFRSTSADTRGSVRHASAIVDQYDDRVARASAGTLALRPTIKNTWESELVPANPLRSRETGASAIPGDAIERCVVRRRGSDSESRRTEQSTYRGRQRPRPGISKSAAKVRRTTPELGQRRKLSPSVASFSTHTIPSRMETPASSGVLSIFFSLTSRTFLPMRTFLSTIAPSM